MKHDGDMGSEEEKWVKNLMSQMVALPTEEMREQSLRSSLSELAKTRQRSKQNRAWLWVLKLGSVGITIALIAMLLPHSMGQPEESNRMSMDSSAAGSSQMDSNHATSNAVNKFAALSSRKLSVGHVTLGDSYSQLIDHYGVPIKVINKGNEKQLFYEKKAVGIRVSLNKNQHINTLHLYPKHLHLNKPLEIPFTKEEAIQYFGTPTSTMSSCNDTCYTLNYIRDHVMLTVQLTKDNKTVEVISLLKNQ